MKHIPTRKSWHYAHDGGTATQTTKSRRPGRRLGMLGLALLTAASLSLANPQKAQASGTESQASQICAEKIAAPEAYRDCVFDNLPAQVQTSGAMIDLTVTNPETGEETQDQALVAWVAARNEAESWDIYLVIPQYNYVAHEQAGLSNEKMVDEMLKIEASLRLAPDDERNIFDIAAELGPQTPETHILRVGYDLMQPELKRDKLLKTERKAVPAPM